MNSIIETGHAVNHGNTYKLASFVKGYGVKYNPSNPDLLYANIMLQYDAETAALKLVSKNAAPWVNNVNNRQIVLELLDPTLTKVFNSIASSKASAQSIADVESRIKKMKGIRIHPKIKMEPADPTTPTDDSINQISASQTGIDHIIDDFTSLIEYLSIETYYTPNEDEIKVANLTLFLKDIVEKNKAVIDVFPDLDNARIARDLLMYGEGGSNELASKVKKYVRSVFGGDSREYHQLGGLAFTKPKK
jgi:hypothetical protein